MPLKQRNQIGIPLLPNAKRKKKNSKFILAKHMIKRDMNIGRRMVKGTKTRNNIRNKKFIERVRKRRKKVEETSEVTFNRFKLK